MTPGVVVFFLLALLLWLLPWTVALAVGLRTLRTSRVTARVPVTAVVVERTHLRQPNHITFDYPLPSGQWVRARRTVHLPLTSSRGLGAEEGDHLTVWVDPDNPHAVSLNQAGEKAVVGAVLVVMSSVVLLVTVTTLALIAVRVTT